MAAGEPDGDEGVSGGVARNRMTRSSIWSNMTTGQAFCHDRRLVPAGSGGVAVHAVFADVEFSSVEPFRVRGLPIEHFRPRLLPSQLLGFTRPEDLGLVDGFLVELLVGRQRRDAGFCGKLFGWQVNRVLIVVQRGFFGAHGV